MTTPAVNENGGTPHGNQSDVNVEIKESIGIMILGFMFFIVLLSMLRAQRRERKLLEKLADMQAELTKLTNK